ncbi:ketoacyl-synthetase C-terminal extension domain-containing protein [Thermocatellispora tengchongensis]|uniref:ketoacyl-synthetase C-terminal extension domain-containing protein n=1 Tax=Thermocatellispora tengchongensis TaxID=1073253 RepID=UPI003642A888
MPHFGVPSTRVDWSAGAVVPLTADVPWRRRHGRPRRAGVSAFGISGTNAHVILEEPDDGGGAAGPPPGDASGHVPWLLSARSPAALRAQAERLLASVRRGADIAAVGHALATTRAVFEHRAAIVADDLAGFTGPPRGSPPGNPPRTRTPGWPPPPASPPSSSPATGRNGRAWDAACTSGSRRSRRPWTRRWTAWTTGSSRRRATCCSPPPVRPRPR